MTLINWLIIIRWIVFSWRWHKQRELTCIPKLFKYGVVSGAIRCHFITWTAAQSLTGGCGTFKGMWHGSQWADITTCMINIYWGLLSPIALWVCCSALWVNMSCGNYYHFFKPLAPWQKCLVNPQTNCQPLFFVMPSCTQIVWTFLEFFGITAPLC